MHQPRIPLQDSHYMKESVGPSSRFRSRSRSDPDDLCVFKERLMYKVIGVRDLLEV